MDRSSDFWPGRLDENGESNETLGSKANRLESIRGEHQKPAHWFLGLKNVGGCAHPNTKLHTHILPSLTHRHLHEEGWME